MGIKEIVKQLAEHEAKKSQASIGDIRELISILSDMIYEDGTILQALIKNGQKRASKKRNG